MADQTGETDPTSATLDVAASVKELCQQLTVPLMVQLIPEIGRASAHRGEVSDLKHNELYPSDDVRHPPQLAFVGICVLGWH